MPIFKRLWNVIRPHRVSEGIEQETQIHLALLEEEERARGLSPEDARATARRRFGNVTQTNEKTRDMDLLGWLETTRKDLHYAARVLRKSPAFSVFAVGSGQVRFAQVVQLVPPWSSTCHRWKKARPKQT